jgi:hypothetical protein
MTKAKAGDLLFACKTSCCDLAFNATLAKPAGNHNAVQPAQATSSQQTFYLFGLDPLDLDIDPVGETSMLQRFNYREIGIGQADVLTNNSDAHRKSGCGNAGN